MVGAVGISMNLGEAPASIGSSCAGLCKRGRPGRFSCGDHSVKSVAFNAAGTHLARSWRRRAALLLMTPAAVPTRCSQKGLGPMSAEAGCHWLLDDERELVHPVAGSSSLYFCP